MLCVSSLNQYYGGSHILRNLSFEIPPGKVTALLGRNGVGKTTLLKCIAGLVPARSGAIRFSGQAIDALEAPDRVKPIVQAPVDPKSTQPTLSADDRRRAARHSDT